MSHQAATKFVVLFHARSGSTYLISVLKNHPEVHAQGEVLVGMDPDRQLRRAVRAFQIDQTAMPGIKAVGFKCKFRDILDIETFSSFLHEENARIIYMYRENTVKRVISLLNAIRLEEATGFWNLHKEENRPGPFAVDPIDFDQRLRRMEASRSDGEQLVRSLNLPTLTVRYEDLLIDEGSVVERLLPFLGVANLPVGGRTLKTTSDDLRLAITNFDELRDAYIGTVFEPMFDEVLIPEPGQDVPTNP